MTGYSIRKIATRSLLPKIIGACCAVIASAPAVAWENQFTVDHNGNVYVRLTDSHFSNLTLVAGKNDNEIAYTLHNSGGQYNDVLMNVTGDVTIRSYDGVDNIILDVLHLPKSLNIYTGAAADKVELYDVIVNSDLDIDTDSGDDSVSAEGVTVHGNAYIATGKGSDKITLTYLISENYVELKSGSGNDAVDLVGLHLSGASNFILEDGQDTLSLSHSMFERYWPEFNGGSGTDTFKDSKTNSYNDVTAEIVSFEETMQISQEPVSQQPVSSECIDSDGDGYGWDGSKSCSIAEPEATEENVVDDNSQPLQALCIDPDGDGYGWDGTQTCELTSGISEPIIPQPPVNAVCSDPDGDGYGWDGSVSCLVSGSVTPEDNAIDNSNPPSNNNECIDPDGDGFGWDGVQTCRLTPINSELAAETPVEQPVEEQPVVEQPTVEQPVEEQLGEPPVETPVQEQPNEELPVEMVYNVGDRGPGGGIVFQVDASGASGLEIMPIDITGSRGAAFGCETGNVAGIVDGDTGAQSGADKSAALVALGCSQAATLTSNYSAPNGTEDWYLPSATELISAIRTLGENALPNQAFGYWSSSEDYVENAFIVFNTAQPFSSTTDKRLDELASSNPYWVNVAPIRNF